MPAGPAKRSRLDLQRAVRLFHVDERAVDSPFVEKVWRTRSVPLVPYEAFADQSDLTRSLKRFLGQTPAVIAAEAG